MKKSLLKRLPLARGKGKFKSRVSRRAKIAAFKSKKTTKKSTKASK